MAPGVHIVNGEEKEYSNELQKWDQKYTELIIDEPRRALKKLSKVIGEVSKGFLTGYTLEQAGSTCFSPSSDLFELMEPDRSSTDLQDDLVVAGLIVGGIQDAATALAGVMYWGARAITPICPHAKTLADAFDSNPYAGAAVSLFNAKVVGQTVSAIYSLGKKIGAQK